MCKKVTASIVLYNNPIDQIIKVVDSFYNSYPEGILYLVDNSPNDYLKTLNEYRNLVYIYANSNKGYGAGHNVALKLILDSSIYHIVLNPDIEFGKEVVYDAIDYMDGNVEVGLLSPKIIYPNGEQQLMCRLLPTPFDLIIRRFLPSFLKGFFRQRIDAYLLTGLDLHKEHNIANLPGSFMFLRVSSLKNVGIFDENFFMYLEDVDLTRRLNERFKTIYYPKITVSHELAQGSYTSVKLMLVHVKSAIYYFNKWGWFYDKFRKGVNSKLERELNHG